MFDTVNEVSVLVAALLALAVGSIWYSPLAFGRAWQRATGLSDEDLVLSRRGFLKSLIVAYVSNLIVFFSVAHALRLGDLHRIDASVVIGFVFLLVVSGLVSAYTWERKSLTYFVIHAGYAALVLSLGSLVVLYWPW